MVQSMNTNTDVVVEGMSYHTMLNAARGKMMVGDKAFEFYNGKNFKDYIQIPYDEIDHVLIQVLNKGKSIRSFVVKTKSSGDFRFNSKDAGKLLKAMQNYLEPEQMQKSRNLIRRTQVIVDYLKKNRG
ncbi:MAG: DUF956 family protein [Streptococcaceae bacterium]|jgi:hypothetical protein|nr:DUF956 family protein [Streptococcaceae bacterium]